MDTKKLTKSIVKLRRQIGRKSPAILTGLGIAGMFTAIGTGIKATPKALAILDIYREREEEGFEEPLTKWKIVKLTWKCYIPPAITAGVSTACLIGANTVGGKQKAALATAYALSEQALNEYKDKIVEVVGKEKAEEVRDAVAKNIANTNSSKSKEIVILPKGKFACYEPLSARFFDSDKETILKAVNDLNRRMQTEMYVSINELYSELGLPTIDPCVGDECGWNIGTGYIDIDFSAIVADDGRPCLVLDYLEPPHYGYNL